MDQRNLLDALRPEELRERVRAAFTKCGVYTVEALRDDIKIAMVTRVLYDELPTFPYKTLVKATIGRDGFDRLIFHVRDYLLSKATLDLSILDGDFFRNTLDRVRTRQD